MRLSRLELRDFRNYVREVVDPGPGMNIFAGDNGQGKSNLLEAAAWLAVGRSPRRAREADAVRHGADGFLVRAVGQGRAGSMVREMSFRTEGGRRLTQDGKCLRQVKDLLGGIRVVHFSPDDLFLVGGGPERRRRFLDLMIAQVSAGYVGALTAYHRFLLQRNALLKEMRQHRRPMSVMAALEEGMAREGAKVAAERARVVEEAGKLAETAYRQISGGREKLEICYAPSAADEEALRVGLERRRGEELARGTSLVGPHRDEVRITLNGRPARLYGSQGQMRSVALSLRLAERRWMCERTGEDPVMLLDDLSSELDPGRRSGILRLLAGTAQVFLTCTDQGELPGELGEAQYFRVEEGRVRRER